MNQQPRMQQAVLAWQSLLGVDCVAIDEESTSRYQSPTSGATRQVPVVLRPRAREQVADIVRIARRFRIPLYPISTGANWGYGCNTPAQDGCAVVDLSGLNAIVDLDPDLGTVTLEPGVTQRQLSELLETRGLPFLVPVTGAGPHCSIVGNAVERGYGITPHMDHFAAVTSMEVVLPDGTVYHSALSEMGATAVDGAFKWGVGPYLDGLFTQGNLGIVTRLTIVLARRQETTEAFFFWVERDDDLEKAVVAVRDVQRNLSGVVGAINLLNARRVLSMMVPYPRDHIPQGEAMSDALVAQLSAKHGVTPWTGVGGLYGARRIVRAARKEIRKRIGPIAKRIVFVSSRMAALASRVVPYLPFGLAARLSPLVKTVRDTLDILEGRPSEVALPLAYWKSGTRPAPGVPMNPQRDGCGLLWFAPLVPMAARNVRAYVDMVNRVAVEHGVEPLITLTTLSERCFDSTVPILFDRNDKEELQRALACQTALLHEGLQQGAVPYRVGTHGMGWLNDHPSAFWNTARLIKQTLDPHGIIAPGRYICRATDAPAMRFLESVPLNASGGMA